mmetsp:Transcript_2696/g.4349  ORF Transcript_2696/g.4349 Transcript_2696/m.4349 type:complete len:825 (+) Transcript_2696:1622-4096(+)
MQLWSKLQKYDCRRQFGLHLKKQLLSGTEWVQTLSAGVQSKMQNGVSLTKRTQDQTGKESFASSADARLSTDKGDPEDAEHIGNQFWELLTECVELMWDPELQHECLTKISKKFAAKDIRESHLTTIGTSIEYAAKHCLGSEWDVSYSKAWSWFWDVISRPMAHTFRDMEEQHGKLLTQSWQLCKEKHHTEELGEAIFKELTNVAAHVVQLFKRPKHIQAHQFVAVVDMLVMFVKDPEVFYSDLRPLTIRHIKYGVKSEYAKGFGAAILRAVEKVLGPEHWDQATRSAWNFLWMRVCGVIQRSLNAGTNLVVVALVNHDVVRMREAMACAPRGERENWLTHVDVNGEVLSPLYWSIRDGMRDIALYLLDDLLSLRADRESYYYGRETMFRTHHDIVKVLCEDPGAFELLDALLDGLMWHAEVVEKGKIRVNYYIKELFGDPSQVGVGESGLAVLGDKGPPEIFEHPVVQKLLELKWHSYGIWAFIACQTVYLLITLSYFVAFVSFRRFCDGWIIPRLIIGSLSILLLVVMFAFTFYQMRNNHVANIEWPWFLERIRVRRDWNPTMTVPRLLMNSWNISRILGLALIVSTTFSDQCRSRAGSPDNGRRVAEDRDGFHEPVEWHQVLASFAALLMGFQVLEATLLVPTLSRMILVIQQLLGDFVRFIFLVFVILFTFAGAITVSQEVGFEDYWDSITRVHKMLLSYGNGELDELGTFSLSLVSVLLIIIHMALFNMMSAQFVHGSSRVAELADCLVQQRIAQAFDEPLNFGPGDDGPSGGIACDEPASVRSNSKYRPDRVMRFTADATKKDPWPAEFNAMLEADGD